MADLGISLTPVVPVARRVAALEPGYPHGDALDATSSLIENGGQNACKPVFPNRAPRKFPDNLDWRDPGFLPWSQKTATASPAAYQSTFLILDGESPWPDASDHLKDVWLFPRTNPSSSATSVVWDVIGLAGGTIAITTDYLPFDERTQDHPGGSLRIRAEAVTLGGTVDNVRWQSQLYVRDQWLQYSGPFEWWGPIPVDGFESIDEIPGGCSECPSVEFSVTLPGMGLGSSLVGGDQVAQLNGMILGYNAFEVPGCNWVRATDTLLPVPEEWPCAPGTQIRVSTSARVNWDPVGGIVSADIRYLAQLPQIDPTEGCQFYHGGNCCCHAQAYYNGGMQGTCSVGGGGQSCTYIASMLGPRVCNEIQVGLSPRTMQLVNRVGFGWAGNLPDVLTLP